MSSVQSIISNYHFLSTFTVSPEEPHGPLFYDCFGQATEERQQAPHDLTSYWNNSKFLRETTEDCTLGQVAKLGENNNFDYEDDF